MAWPSDGHYYSLEELAKELGVSVSTIGSWLRKGKLRRMGWRWDSNFGFHRILPCVKCGKFGTQWVYLDLKNMAEGKSWVCGACANVAYGRDEASER
jgi:hypothetical protein